MLTDRLRIRSLRSVQVEFIVHKTLNFVSRTPPDRWDFQSLPTTGRGKCLDARREVRHVRKIGDVKIGESPFDIIRIEEAEGDDRAARILLNVTNGMIDSFEHEDSVPLDTSYDIAVLS